MNTKANYPISTYDAAWIVFILKLTPSISHMTLSQVRRIISVTAPRQPRNASLNFSGVSIIWKKGNWRIPHQLPEKFIMSAETEHELGRISANAAQNSVVDPEEAGSTTSAHEFSLPPVDGGKDAWLMLVSAFFIESFVWGNCCFSTPQR